MIVSASHNKTGDFAALYHTIRQKEGRIYTDEEVASLPVIRKSHPHYREWQLRKRSCNKLITYLRKKQSSPGILEVGCGNGWMARHLATVPGSSVTGLDINIAELRQAERVFNHITNLRFIHDTVHTEILDNASFDIVVMAACIQYFPFVPWVVHSVFRLLKDNGEIHILDSPFYQPGEVPAARQRTSGYYLDMGLPEMKDYYFHHAEASLDQFDYNVLYRPSFFSSLLFRNNNPFPWICIKKTGSTL